VSTIATTTNTNPFLYPGNSLLWRDLFDGFLWCMVKSSTADTYSVYRSVDNGANWALFSSVVRASIVEIGTGMVKEAGAPPSFLHWCYRTNESSEDRIYFRRLDLTTGIWSSEVLLSAVANGGTPGAVYTGMDIRMVNRSAPGIFHVVAVGTAIGGSIGVTLFGVFEYFAFTPSTTFLTGTRQWLPEVGSGRITPSLDTEHPGDAYGAQNNLWLAFGRTQLHMVKLAWTGDGWSGPPNTVLVRSGLTAQNSMPGRWDGQRFLMAVPNPTAGMTSTVAVFERNRANSATIERVTPVHPTGVVRNCTLSYNSVTGDIRVYAIGTSTAVLYYVDFIRATGLWSSWTQVGALSAVLGTNGENYGVRRSTHGNARYDVYTAHSGNTTTHTQQSLSFAPNTPTWVAPVNGQPADVALSLLLDWTFTDPDPTDTQKDFAISRQIGAGALAYFRASDSTWQAAEVQNASGTSSRTLAAAWGVHTDAVHTYKVKVWDQANVASAYSDAMAVTPSTPVNPTITAPTPAQVISGDQVTITWTVSEQTAWRVELLTNPGGVVVFDTGWAPNSLVPGTPSQLTYTVPAILANGSGWTLRLTTRNAEGLAGAPQTVNFTVAYVPPAAPTLVATPQPTLGVIRVVTTNPTPVGTQPAAATNDVLRRAVGDYSTNLIPNPFFETDLTGWTAVGGGGAAPTMTRDNAFAHEGTWSMKLVPGGGPWAAGETAHLAAVQGQAYTASAWIRTVTANKPASIWLHWHDAAHAFISSTQATVAAQAGAWLFVTVTAAPPPTGAYFSVGAGVSGTPAGGDICYCDEVKAGTADPGLSTVRVGAGVAPNGTHDDWQAVGLVSYEYAVLTNAVNGTSTTGPWQA